jgi:2-alkyl-3-oxoalkanoate reductase
MSLQQQKVLITGATGFIGSHLAERLVRGEGALVSGVGRYPEKALFLQEAGVALHKADVTDTAAMRELVAGQDILFHAAAWLGRPARDAATARRVNVTATADLIRLAAAAGVRRFVHISTIAAYGPPPDSVVSEDYPLNLAQNSLYGRSKAEAEREAVRLAAECQLPLTIIRPAMVYGPRSLGWSAGMLELVQKGTPVLFGGGYGHAHPVYIDNLVDGLVLAATRPEAIGQSFHFADLALPWRDFFSYYGTMCGRRPRQMPLWLVRILVTINEYIGAAFPVDRESLAFYTAKSSYPTHKAESLLGYRATIDIDEGMRRTEAWLRQAGYLPGEGGRIING